MASSGLPPASLVSATSVAAAPPARVDARPGLWARYKHLLRRLATEQVDATGLAFFRMAFYTIMLLEVGAMYYFRSLMYDVIPGVQYYDVDFSFPLLVWLGVLVLLILGLFTRPALLINHAFIVIFMTKNRQFLYHMYATWLLGNFLMLFIPISQRYSLDRLRQRLRFTSTRQQLAPPLTVNKLSYYVLILFCVGATYVNSMLYKLPTHLWMSGLGTWLPASMPFMARSDFSWLLNIKPVVIFLGYFTLAFEAGFIFLFPFRKLRPWLALAGFGLHFGIFLIFPIPWFGLGWCALYILVLPPAFWTWLTGETRPKPAVARAPRLVFYYDAECPLCAQTRAAITHFDTRGAVAFRSIQMGAAAEPALAEIPVDDLYHDVFSVRADGRVFRGFDTYLEVLAAIWYLRPLGWVLRLPGIAHLSRRLYQLVAANRTTERCTEENCGFTPAPLPTPDADRRVLRNLSLADLKHGLAIGGITALIVLQVVGSYLSPLAVQARQWLHLSHSIPDRVATAVAENAEAFSLRLVGICNHGVFVDRHFDGYNHILAVTYVHPDGHEEFLPITRPTGQPSWYTYSAIWTRWVSFTDGPKVLQPKVFAGVRDWSAFWAMKHGVRLENARFNLKVKKVDTATGWEHDFLHRQMQHPWLDGGYVQWTNRQAEPHLKVVEEM